MKPEDESAGKSTAEKELIAILARYDEAVKQAQERRDFAIAAWLTEKIGPDFKIFER